MSEQCVDLTYLRELTGGDAELESELFDEFIMSSQKLISELEQALQSNNEEEWKKAAHAIKGISANLGAKKLSELSKDAQEMLGAQTNMKKNLLEQMHAELTSVLSFLKNQ